MWIMVKLTEFRLSSSLSGVNVLLHLLSHKVGISGLAM